ncbi:MAG TPA: hypothetical protein VGP72_00600 [Planctomycetota bacterium]|jgi:hypothetical protein
MTSLRKLNVQGLKVLADFLDSLKTANPQAVPVSALTDSSTSAPLSVQVEVEQQVFGSRFAAAEYFYSRLHDYEAAGIVSDPGVWAWLSLFYFDQLCPGRSAPGEIARWIPPGPNWKYYRHLLAGPYYIYRSFSDAPDQAMILLYGPLDKPGDFNGQLAARQDFVSNKALITAATLLYYNPETGRHKRGVPVKEHRAGTLRRFVDVIQQLDMTWDLYSMNPKELLHLLPSEFVRFMPERA